MLVNWPHILLSVAVRQKLDKIDVVPNDFGTPLEVFEQVYEHECRVSKMIDALVDVAAAEKR